MVDGAGGVGLGDEGITAGRVPPAEGGGSQVGVLGHAALHLLFCQHPAC